MYKDEDLTTSEDGTITAKGDQHIAGKKHNVQATVNTLRVMTGSPAAQAAADIIERFQRMLLPVFMGVSERTLVGEPVPDGAPIFTFSGSGGSDFTFMGEFRSLMGDDREAVKAYEEEMRKQNDFNQESGPEDDASSDDEVGPEASH